MEYSDFRFGPVHTMERQGVDMNSTFRLTGRLVAAGRVLTGIRQNEHAVTAGIPLEMLHLLESNGAAWILRPL